MNVAYRRIWTQEEFFAWVVDQEERYEFDGVRPVLVNGGTNNHSRIMRNLFSALESQLRGSPFEWFGPSSGVETLNGAIRYPDALVFTGPIEGTALKVPNVVATFEVLSPSTARSDRTTKLREYGSVPTIRHYVLIETTRLEVLNYARPDGSTDWQWTRSRSLADHIDLPMMGARIALADLYSGVQIGP